MQFQPKFKAFIVATPSTDSTIPEIPRSAYLHIPFCRRRCFYCDFPVSVVGDRKQGEDSGTIVEYVEWLITEIENTPVWGQPLKTVFFGGGTPSLLSVSQLSQILDRLDRRFGIAADAEISMEMDPGTFDRDHLAGYCLGGINRVSLGVQAFQDDLLADCGRSHRTGDILNAVEVIREVGIENFSLDLISGLPHQTLEQWQDSLNQAVALNPTHISSYDLIVEAGTAFSRTYEPGVSPLPTDESSAQMYRMAVETLTGAGYEHYEVSNYAQSAYQCRHNRVYWENRPCYGFGMGAASYVGGQRFTRPRTRREYYAWVQEWQSSGGVLSIPETPGEEVLLETLMLGLRLADGIDIARFTQQFGGDRLRQLWHCLLPYYRQGWVQVHSGSEFPDFGPTLPPSGAIRLSDPEGFLFSNTILATIFEALEK
ncbi:radical SAM family heme chaperone HemW [Laspinema sp. D3]|nr:radical SAM family heme chaperone HemW [Laspinema sp. D2c]